MRSLPTFRALLAALVALAVAPAAAAAADATVTTDTANTFTSASVDINAGEKVTWNFTAASGAHTIDVLAAGEQLPATATFGNEEFKKFTPGAGTYQQTFAVPGVYNYLCTLHLGSNMVGKVTVHEAVPPPPPPPPDTKPLPPEPIAFASQRAGTNGLDIFTMKDSFASPHQLTSAAGDDTNPAFSPAGGRIAFQSRRNAVAPSDADIFVMKSDGSGQTNLTQGSQARNATPAWSPDGKRLAFSSDRLAPGNADGNADIYVMNADGTGLRRITTETSEDTEPSWTADGLAIVFVSDRDGIRDLWGTNVDPDGSGPGTGTIKMIAGGITGLQSPVVSPDGNHIAYAKFRGGGPDLDICVLEFGAASDTCLTRNTNNDSDPSYSPDGKRIMYARAVHDSIDPTKIESDLFVVAVDGSNDEGDPVTTLADGKQFGVPSWSGVITPGTEPTPTPSPSPTPTPTPTGGGTAPPPTGGGGTSTGPGTAPPAPAFLGLDEPHGTRLRAFKRLGLAVVARCVGVDSGVFRIRVAAKLARALRLKSTTLASAPARCGGDKRASAVLRPGRKVKAALAAPGARKLLARGLKTTVSIAMSGGGSTLRAKLAVRIRS